MTANISPHFFEHSGLGEKKKEWRKYHTVEVCVTHKHRNFPQQRDSYNHTINKKSGEESNRSPGNP